MAKKDEEKQQNPENVANLPETYEEALQAELEGAKRLNKTARVAAIEDELKRVSK